MKKKYNKVGRPPRHIAAQRELAINLSWKVVLDYLENPRADMKHKVEIAKTICAKNIPTQIEGHTKDTNVIILKFDGGTVGKDGNNSQTVPREILLKH